MTPLSQPFSFVQKEFYALNAQTTQPKSPAEISRLHPSASSAPNYSFKNRYGDVLPLEQHRVRLADVSNDYINASHVGPEPGQFICSQAPLPSTFLDFWRMAWQERSPLICSLNREFERGVLKGDVYWPLSTNSPVVIGHFHIALEAAMDDEELQVIVRHLRIRNELNGEIRRIVQLQYLGWPDKGVPDSTSELRELLNLHSYYRLQKSPSSTPSSSPETNVSSIPLDGPTIIHCSAGVGRTGAFVASALISGSQEFRAALHDSTFLNEFLQHLPSSDSHEAASFIPGYYIPQPAPREDWQQRISVFGVRDIVALMRKQRNHGMVQTEEQYALVYDLLKDTIVDHTRRGLPHRSFDSPLSELCAVSAAVERAHRLDERRAQLSPSETRSDGETVESPKPLTFSGARSSPIPRRALVKKGRKRQMDWENLSDDSMSVSSVNDNESSNDVSDDVMQDTPRSSRRKIARKAHQSPGQEEALQEQQQQLLKF